MSFHDILLKGELSCPAWKRYVHGASVSCDKCNTPALAACIGYQKQDLCLSCAHQIAIDIQVQEAKDRKPSLFPKHPEINLDCAACKGNKCESGRMQCAHEVTFTDKKGNRETRTLLGAEVAELLIKECIPLPLEEMSHFVRFLSSDNPKHVAFYKTQYDCALD